MSSDAHNQAPAPATAPRVSVCLPVYQGEEYLQSAIDSVLRQSFADLELIISDNASTDRTGEIARTAAAADPRVIYSRSDVNRGLAWNHNRAFEFVRGAYVMWMGHDDLLAPDYVARCVTALEQDPGAVLAYTHTNDIDGSGAPLRQVELPILGQSDSPSRRFREAVQYESRCDVIFGLMRSDVVRMTGRHAPVHGSDWVLIAEMALRGRFAQVNEFLFSRRKHASQASRANDRWQNTLVFDPGKAGQTIYPFLDLVRAFGATKKRVQLPLLEHLRCRLALMRWTASRWRFVRDDLVVGISDAIKRRLTETQIERVKTAKRLFVGS